MSRIYCDSEIGALKRVLIHAPDDGIGRITPKRAEELLFDDIVSLSHMQAEHALFRQILSVFVGDNNVVEVQDLLKEALNAHENKKQVLLEMILAFEELPARHLDELMELDTSYLTNLLITGYHQEADLYLFDPIPNYIFTRDIAVVIKDHVIITRAAKVARQRENLLTRFIFFAHPSFTYLQDEDLVLNLNDAELFPPSKRGKKVYMEGGDVMIYNDETVFIGHSERTTNHAFRSLKEKLFEKGLVNQVVQMTVPNERSFMHIDTLFTAIDTDCIVCFKPIVFDGHASNVLCYERSGKRKSFASIADYFRSEINPDMKFIFSGNGQSPFQEREQWTDSCNLLMVRPGVGITYDRNELTAHAFEEAGYEILPAKELLEGVRDESIDAHLIEKTIVTFPSFELSRGRGGSHCMTCPLDRGPIVG